MDEWDSNSFNGIDYTGSDYGSSFDSSVSYPTSALDTGGTSFSVSPAWQKLLQGSVSKGLDYFMAKDAYVTRTSTPNSYGMTYVRGADGRLYTQNGVPVTGAQATVSGNPMLLMLILGAVLLMRKG